MQRALGTARVWNVVVKEQRVHGERLKFTLMCTFLVKLRVVDTKCRYVVRYDERLAQQESGAALSNSSMYVAAIIQGVH